MRDGLPRAPYITPRDERPYVEEEESLSSFKEQELYEERKEIIKKEILQEQKRWTKIKEERLRSLKLIGSELIGNIFERVKFLDSRIADIGNSLKSRQDINIKATEEITKENFEKSS